MKETSIEARKLEKNDAKLDPGYRTRTADLYSLKSSI